MQEYVRKPLFSNLWNNLHGLPNLIQVINGPRQVGKTTLALQVMEKWRGPKLYETADTPDIPPLAWIQKHWLAARELFDSTQKETLLIFDEIQKIPRWSNMVKKLFDEDRHAGNKIRLILLGSSALLMQRGLTESLAGRFEIHRHPHWSFSECRQLFSLSLNEYLCFGGYPGALPMRKNWDRWSRYIRDSLIETVLSKDVLLMMPVTKPALLRQIFSLAVSHPAEILSYQKMLGQLQEAGNTTTIASYLKLLSNAFLATSLERWSGSRIKQRGSIPKLLVLDNAFISAMSGRNVRQIKKDPVFWGRLVENAVGAKLYPILQMEGKSLSYWRDRQEEVDYVFETGDKLYAIEVKSTAKNQGVGSLLAFARKYPKARLFLISPAKLQSMKKIRQITLIEFFEDPKKSLLI